MLEVYYDGSLEGLFKIFDKVCQTSGCFMPDRIRREQSMRFFNALDQEQPELFGEAQSKTPSALETTLHLAGMGKVPEGSVGELYEVSIQAYTRFIQAWMSELPIEAEIIRFAWTVMSAAKNAGRGIPLGSDSRGAAEKVIQDRGNPLIRKILSIAYQVQHEIHRLMGFLRFTPNPEGIYLAHCGPDYCTLPAVVHHFTLRFGDIPWAIIDEKRHLLLIRIFGQDPQLLCIAVQDSNASQDSWEELWKNYHRSINNGNRNKPELQRQFMPVRYWKYLSEL